MDMSSVATLSPRELDVRARIVETAEALFRDIGYQKTTVADIAKALKMSPANVYRFFDSKKSINEAVAERVTAAVRARMAAIACRPAGRRAVRRPPAHHERLHVRAGGRARRKCTAWSSRP